MMKAKITAAVAAAALLALGGAAQAQSGATNPPISGQSGSGAGMSTPGAVENEIKNQLLAMGYTDVGPVTEKAAGVYETKATREGQMVSLQIDAKSGEIRERKG